MPHKPKKLYVINETWGRHRGICIIDEVEEGLTEVELSMAMPGLTPELIPGLFNQLPSRLTYFKVNFSPLLFADNNVPEVRAKVQQAFDELFARCQELTELDLSACRFKFSEEFDLKTLLRHAPASLRHLNLSLQFFSEGEELCRILRQIPPTITQLDLSNNLIGAIGLIFGTKLHELMQAVPRHLQFLDLSGNLIQNISIKKLDEILQAENLNPAMDLKLFPDSTATVADLRRLTAGLIEKGLEKASCQDALQGLAQENKLIDELQEVPQTAQFIDLSKSSFEKISIARLSEILSNWHVRPTTRIKLLPNKTTTIRELAHLVESLNAEDKLKSCQKVMASPFVAISWSETGVLQIDFDNAGHCEEFVNEFTAREKKAAVPEPFRHSLAYTDNPQGLVLRNTEPNTLLLTPYQPPSNQAGIEHFGVNFMTPECLKKFLVQLFHIEVPPAGVNSSYYIDKADHHLKRVDFDQFNAVAGHERKDVLFDLFDFRPSTLFLNSEHPLFQQGFVVELKKCDPLSNQFTVEVVDGHIQRFNYQDRLRQLLPTEEAFLEHRLLELWAGELGHSITDLHYEQDRVDHKGVWLLTKDTVTDEQFNDAHVHPQTQKFILYKGTSSLKLFRGSEKAQHANWIFLSDAYLQGLKAQDPQFGALEMVDWVKQRLPEMTAKKGKTPDFKKIIEPIARGWELVDEDKDASSLPPPPSSSSST